MKHDLLVDVSGRLEKHDRKDAALAFSDGIEAAVFISGKVKIAVNRELREQGLSYKRIGIRIFVAGVYLPIELHG